MEDWICFLRRCFYVTILGDHMCIWCGSRRCGRTHNDNRIARLRPLSGIDGSAAARELEEGNRMAHVTADSNYSQYYGPNGDPYA
jgi:hypothetical protein